MANEERASAPTYETFTGHQTIRPQTRTEYIGLDGQAYSTESTAHFHGAVNALRAFLQHRVMTHGSTTDTLHQHAKKMLEHAAELVRIMTVPKNPHELESIAHQFCVDEGQEPPRTLKAPKSERRVDAMPDDYEDDDADDISNKVYDSDDIINAFRKGAEWGGKLEPIKGMK